MDDSAVYEKKPVIGSERIQGALDYVREWSEDNYMNLKKPKSIVREHRFGQLSQCVH